MSDLQAEITAAMICCEDAETVVGATTRTMLKETLRRSADEIERLRQRFAELEAENSRLVAANKARDEFLRGHRYKRSEMDQYIDLCESQIADWHRVADERSAEIVRLSARLAEAEALLLQVTKGGYPHGMSTLVLDIEAFLAPDSASGEATHE